MRRAAGRASAACCTSGRATWPTTRTPWSGRPASSGCSAAAADGGGEGLERHAAHHLQAGQAQGIAAQVSDARLDRETSPEADFSGEIDKALARLAERRGD